MLFPNETDDYIELDDIDGIEVILENWKTQIIQNVLNISFY